MVGCQIAYNTKIDAMENIQLIDKQKGSCHMIADGIELFFMFKPITLFKDNDLYPLNPDCKNGLRWRIKRNSWLSYWQIKEAIK